VLNLLRYFAGFAGAEQGLGPFQAIRISFGGKVEISACDANQDIGLQLVETAVER
jgi:hypothetical protein